MRERLPDRRGCCTQKLRVGQQTVYLTVGEYPDGRLGEIFIDVSKRGTAARGLIETTATLFSVALQYGATLDELLPLICALDFPPEGNVEGAEDLGVTTAISILDAVGQVLRAAYCKPEAKA